MAKNLVSGLILAHLAKIQVAKFFFKNQVLSVFRCHGQLSSCTILKKTNDPILRKLSDGQTDRQTDRQIDKSDFISCCPINVECPTKFTKRTTFMITYDTFGIHSFHLYFQNPRLPCYFFQLNFLLCSTFATTIEMYHL